MTGRTTCGTSTHLLWRVLPLAAAFSLAVLAEVPVSPQTFNYDDAAAQILARWGNNAAAATERDLLLLMSRPQEFQRLIEDWRARGAGELADRALKIRHDVFRRALDRMKEMLKHLPPAERARAVIALGSWAEALNTGDMDIVTTLGRGDAALLNRLMGDDVNGILAREGDDVCAAIFGAQPPRFTLDVLEIYTSTIENFGYAQLKKAYGEALKMALTDEAAGAAHLAAQADEILWNNLRAQSWAAAHPEMYPGAAGQDFLRGYFNSPGKSRTWLLDEGGTYAQKGLQASQLSAQLLESMGLSTSQITGVFDFPLLTKEFQEWVLRTPRGAREQAKGLVRATEGDVGRKFYSYLSPQQQDAYAAARIIQNLPRESEEAIAQVLRGYGFLTEEAFAEAGQEALYVLTRQGYGEAARALVDNWAKANAAGAAGRLTEAQGRRLMDYLMGHEMLAGMAQLPPETLRRLAVDIPPGVWQEEMAALMELMAQGIGRTADDAAVLTIRLLRVAGQQGRITTEAMDAAIGRVLQGEALGDDLAQQLAVLRQDLADLATIHAMSPEGRALAECIEDLLKFRRGAPNMPVTAELQELVEYLLSLNENELLRLGFRDSEIVRLRSIFRCQAEGLRPSAVGEKLAKASPQQWRTTLKVYAMFSSAILAYQVISIANDPNISEADQNDRMAEAVYTTLPPVDMLVQSGLALDAALRGYDIDKPALFKASALGTLELAGLALDLVGATSTSGGLALGVLVVYGGGSFVFGQLDREDDRAFLSALHFASIGERGQPVMGLRVLEDGQPATRSFLITAPQIVPDLEKKIVRIVHSPAFDDLYGPRGDVLLAPGEFGKPYETKVREAVYNFASRHVFPNSPKLKSLETAVRRYFSWWDLDLDAVESWNLAEAVEQARTNERNEFRVGMRLLRRYLNERDLLVEATLAELKRRVDDIGFTMAHLRDFEEALKTLEKQLKMEDRIVPNAQAEIGSLSAVLASALTSGDTAVERWGKVWRGYLSTYQQAVDELAIVSKSCDEVSLPPPTGRALFALTGKRDEDQPKIDAVSNEWRVAFGKMAQDFRAAKGGAVNRQDPFDADAWKRLHSLRLRVFLTERLAAAMQAKVTIVRSDFGASVSEDGEIMQGGVAAARERIERLKKEADALIAEIKEHYRGKIVFEIDGPDEVKIGERVTFRAKVTSGDITKVPGARWVWTPGFVAGIKEGETFEHTFEHPDPQGRISLELLSKTADGERRLGDVLKLLNVKDLDRTVLIDCPDEIVETELFDVSAKLSADLQGKERKFEWSWWNVASDPKDTGAVKMQYVAFESRENLENYEGTVSVSVKDKDGKWLGDGRKKISVYRAQFSGATPGNWEGGNHNAGVDLSRKKAIHNGTYQGTARELASVWAQLRLRFGDDAVFGSPKTPEDVTRLFTEFYESDKRAQIKPIEVDGFTGAMVVHPVRYRGGGWSFDAGYRSASVEASIKGCVMKGKQCISLSGSVGGSGMFDNSEHTFMTAQADAAFQEMVGFLTSWKITKSGTIEKNPYDGPKLDGSDLPVVKITPANTKVRLGETITFTATVENAKNEDLPLQFAWSDGCQGQNEKATWQAKGPGKHTISCNVGGARYAMGTGSVDVEVLPLTAVVAKTAPAGDQIVVGEQVGLEATLTSEGQPVRGEYTYRWEPRGLTFTKQDETAADTAVTFDTPGQNKVWVSVLCKVGDTLETVATSDTLDLEVIQPALKIAFQPREPYIGQTTTVTAELNPDPGADKADIRWEFKGNVQELGESRDTRQRTFRPKDAKPVKVTARARVKGSGDDLGEATGDLTAKLFDVSATVTGSIGPKPRVWREGVGLVEETKALAVDQHVRVRAAIEPEPERGPAKFRWSLNENSHMTSAGLGTEITVYRSEVGTCTATVVAEDSDGNRLGEGTAEFSVTISRKQLNASGPGVPEDPAQAAAAKLTSAKTRAKTGDLDGAIADAEEAERLDPKSAEARRFAKLLRAEKIAVTDQLGKARTLAEAGRFAEAAKELAVAKALHPSYPAVAEAEKTLAAATQKAVSDALAGTNQTPGNAAGTADKQLPQMLVDLQAARDQCDAGLPPAAALERWARVADAALIIAPDNQQVKDARALVAERLRWRQGMDAAPAGEGRLFKVEGQSWGAPLAPGFPTSFARLEATLRYYQPGTVLDQAGIGNAARGSICLLIEQDGRLCLKVFDPVMGSDSQLPRSAWHAVRSIEPLAAGVDHAVTVEHWGDEIAMEVAGRTHLLKLPTRIADTPMWIGDTPADEAFAPGADTHPAMIGLVRTDGFRPIDDLSPHWGQPYQIPQQGDGGILTTAYPRDNLRISMVLRYNTPGTIMGMEATDPLTPGSFNFIVMPDGKLTFGVVSATHLEGAPRADTPTSRTSISPGAYHLVVIEFQAGAYRLWLDGESDSGTGFPATTFSGRPIFLGAIPGGGRVGLGSRPNYPGFTGEVYLGEFRSTGPDVSYARLEPVLRMPDREPAPAGKLKVVTCQKVEDGQPVGVTDAFGTVRAVVAHVSYQDLKVGDKVLVRWERDGQKILEDSSEIKYARGLSWFTMTTQNDMRAGDYRVVLSVGGEVVGEKRFTVGKQPQLTPKLDLVVCERLENGQPVGVGAAFAGAKSIVLFGTVSGFPQGTTLECVWERDGEVMIRDTHPAGPQPGRVKLSIESDTGLPAGDYRVSVRAQGQSLWQKGFSVTAAATTDVAYYHVDLTAAGGKKGTPRKVRDIEMDDGSWIRLKSTDEKRLKLSIALPSAVTARAIAVMSNLDDASYLEQGKTIAKMTVQTTAGPRVFEIKAGVHSAEWNNVGTRHEREIPSKVGDNSHYLALFALPAAEQVTGIVFDYVETNAEKWVGHAPGFCLRGVTLLRDPVAGAEAAPQAPSVEPARGAATPAGWQTVSYGPVSLALPPGWESLGGFGEDFGGWYDGDLLGPDLAVWALRGATSEAIMQQVRDNMGAFTIQSQSPVQLDGLPGVEYAGVDETEDMKGWLIVVTPDVDEKGKIGFLVGSKIGGWERAQPVLRNIIKTIRFAAQG